MTELLAVVPFMLLVGIVDTDGSDGIN